MSTTTATVGQQTKALIQKSWTFQKRNIGSNICLITAPIFFCVVLAVIQVAVNKAFLSSDNLKCGCFCEKCCPDWALTSSPGNYTADGTGLITITNLAAFGGYAALAALPGASITNNTDGTVTVLACGPIANGPCPEDYGYKCLQRDTSKCGIQFSTPSQAQWCAVPQVSAWPPVVQSPEPEARAKPWGSTFINSTLSVARTATLVTGSDAALAANAGLRLFRGNISTDSVLWSEAINRLYSGNASDSALGNIFNGDMLSLLGFQFGTSADPQVSLYFERAFQTGQGLYLNLPADVCVAKGISTTQLECLSGLLLKLFNGNPAVPADVLARSPKCTPGTLVESNASRLLTATDIRVLCTENEVIARPSTAAIDNELYCGYYQARCNLSNPVNNDYQGAYDFMGSGTGKLELITYYNQTTVELTGGGAPTRTARLPGPISDAVAAWWEYVTGDNSPAIRLLGVMSTPKQESKLTLDFSSVLGPLFYTWVVQLLLPTFLQQLVYEKEKRLRMMMKMHGLGDVSYWTVTYLWYLAVYIIYIAIFIIFGALIRLKMFTKTAVGIQIVFYFLFGNCMIAFAFMLSSLFTSSRTAVVVAFLYVFASGLIGELLLQPFMDKAKSWLLYVQWVPAWSLYRGLYEISAYTFLGVYRNTEGLSWSNLSEKGNGMTTTWAVFAVEWALFLLLGLYLEQVVSSGTGIRRRPLFFIEWLWRKPENKNQGVHTDGERSSAPSIDNKMMQGVFEGVDRNGNKYFNDVEAEKQRVQSLTDYTDTPIVVNDIKKVYPGLDGGQPKVAVRSLTLGISRGECFGLLGPNGAGKTTSINMLVGFLEPTAGTAVVEGFDIRSDMRSIYKLMGVCPQHDLLWEQLTGREHLRFYGRLKGLNGPALEEAINAALKAVNLASGGVGDKPAGKYSGGMKRRLSVAISFMGQPKVVYLDEPSTGLDPASRRNLWDVVKSSKEGRSIILTTHSMEEAEQLCDRLGIFVDGQLVCIGNPKEITSRYAGFFVFTISVPADQEQAARQFVQQLSPNATLTYALGGTLKYELPTSEVNLSSVFQAVNAAKGQLNIIDWGVANATLEEVFIKLAKGIGAQSSDH